MSDAVELSVVIPAFNEERYIGATLGALKTAIVEAKLGSPVEVVLVDDGSTDATAARAREAFGPTLQVLSQENKGRLAARRNGIAATAAPAILLLDARTELDPGSLRFWRDQRRDHPDRLAWNGHTRTRTDGSNYAAFGDVITRWAWSGYQGQLSSYGPDDFDSNPKGTTLFVAPRSALWTATEAQVSETSHLPRHLVSDDTAVLRTMIEEVGRFWMSPEFGGWYTSARTNLRSFMGQGLYRGGTFVDGYAGRRSSFGRMSILIPLIAAVAFLFLVLGVVERPAVTTVSLGVTSMIAIGAVTRRARRSRFGWCRAVAIGVLVIPFATSFVPGMWRGWYHRLKNRS